MTTTATFWRNCERYHDLVEWFERTIRATYSDRLTGRSGYDSYGYFWCAQEVTYYKFTGPRQ